MEKIFQVESDQFTIKRVQYLKTSGRICFLLQTEAPLNMGLFFRAKKYLECNYAEYSPAVKFPAKYHHSDGVLSLFTELLMEQFDIPQAKALVKDAVIDFEKEILIFSGDSQKKSIFDANKEAIEIAADLFLLTAEYHLLQEKSVPLSTETKRAEKTKINEQKEILGSIFKPNQLLKIAEIQLESGTVRFCGRVLTYDIKATKKNGAAAQRNSRKNVFLKADITDGSGTITIKAYVDAKTLKQWEIYCGSQAKTHPGILYVRGQTNYDHFSSELTVMAHDIYWEYNPGRIDTAQEKRVELHAHTKMSTMDSVADIEQLVQRAVDFGHCAIAITDHGVVQGYPYAFEASKRIAAKNKTSPIKIIYGLEAYLVNDRCFYGKDASMNEYVVFDIETTGLNKKYDRLIEIGACLIKEGKIVQEFSTFVNPECRLSPKTTELTGITDEMLLDAPKEPEAIQQFLDFAGDHVLCAHNATFDISVMRHAAKRYGMKLNHPFLDTLPLSRMLLPQLTRHRLDVLTKHFSVKLEQHHRAVHDAIATTHVLFKLLELAEQQYNVKTSQKLEFFAELNAIGSVQRLPAYHAILLAKNKEGLRNIYRIVTDSHLNEFGGMHKRPLVRKSYLNRHREGILLGSACEQGEVFRAILEQYDDQTTEMIVQDYDYLEIQPRGNNVFLIANERESTWVKEEEDLLAINRCIVDWAHRCNKPCVATCDVHFINPEDEYFRRILMYIQKFQDADLQPPLYLRTTDEMLKEFSYLGEDVAYEVVVQSTNHIAEQIEGGIPPYPDEPSMPVEKGADELLRTETYAGAHRIYGDPLPELIVKRIEREVGSITKHGFSTLYTSAYHLVKDSNAHGYSVGSRGSVGSSFTAFAMGISEVNPLPPHYRCRKCFYSDFNTKEFAVDCGADLPQKNCPNCGEPLVRDGFEIPFEVFLGFEGDKVPDIDLNFSGEYQENAFLKVEEMFGAENVYRAGTIISLQEKTAYGYVRGYLADHKINASKAEENRLVAGIAGVKRTTGAHPGGMVIVPEGVNVYDFTALQRPADKSESAHITTHFAFESLHDRLVKLDILGHDNPTIMKYLEQFTGIDPQSVPLDDPKVISLFRNHEALNVPEEAYKSVTGSIGLPEFGTSFVRSMLEETKPKTVGELIRICGLSHGTNVWLGNAQEMIRQGYAELKDCIGCRDDILNKLLSMNVPSKTAFTIMEAVRKGKGLKPDQEAIMRECNVPEWYIDSCKRISYLFPKAHAAAYVIATLRIAYFKLYYPLAYYAAFFSVRGEEVTADVLMGGIQAIQERRAQLAKRNDKSARFDKEDTQLEVAHEMLLRGLGFRKPDLYESDAKLFLPVDKNTLLLPFSSVSGIGEAAAQSVVSAREAGPFLTIDELSERTRLNTANIDALRQVHALDDLPQSDQVSLFEL